MYLLQGKRPDQGPSPQGSVQTMPPQQSYGRPHDQGGSTSSGGLVGPPNAQAPPSQPIPPMGQQQTGPRPGAPPGIRTTRYLENP